MKIYTRTGDGGETALFGGGRVGKGHERVEAYGSVDELSAAVGWALTQVGASDVRLRLEQVQHDLFALGADLATPAPADGKQRPKTPELPLARVEEMESWIDVAGEEAGELRDFVLPGGSPGAAALHVARTVCRRAERAVVRLAASEEVSQGIVRYLNRLSDVLFTFARLENARSGRGDVTWRKEPG